MFGNSASTPSPGQMGLDFHPSSVTEDLGVLCLLTPRHPLRLSICSFSDTPWGRTCFPISQRGKLRHGGVSGLPRIRREAGIHEEGTSQGTGQGRWDLGVVREAGRADHPGWLGMGDRIKPGPAYQVCSRWDLAPSIGSVSSVAALYPAGLCPSHHPWACP